MGIAGGVNTMTRRLVDVVIVGAGPAGIFAALSLADHPAKKLYNTVIDTEIDQILRADDPVGSYAYCLNCNIQ